MSPSFLILGDPHIGKGTNLGQMGVGSLLNSRIADQLKILDWVFNQALERNISDIVITGDVFDEPKPSYGIVGLFLEWLQKCSDHDIKVHIIVGNHDILRSGQFMTSPLDVIDIANVENVFVYKNTSTLHFDGMSVTLVPFRDRRSFNTDSNPKALNAIKVQLPYQLASMGKFDKKFLVGHLAIKDSIPIGNEIDDLTNELFCPIEMFAGYDAVWMGHIHKFQVLSKSNPHVAHIGSMDISDFGETDQKKFVAIVSKDKQEYIEIPTRKLLDISIELPETETDVNTFVKSYLDEVSNLKDSIVKLTIKLPSNASYSLDRTSIEKYLKDNGTFFTSKISEEKKFKSLKKQINESMNDTIDEVSAIKTYSSLVEESIREDFIKNAISIVNEFKKEEKE